MALDRQAGGHEFIFSAGVCAQCGTTRETYQNNGEPRCTGRPATARRRDNTPDFVPDDPLEDDR
jgi:hypothetical protein